MKRASVLLVALLVLLVGCSFKASADLTVLKVGATPTPNGEILKFIRDNLAEEAGLKIEMIEFTDYIQPNAALADGQLDANFFQHKPFMEQFAVEKGVDLVALADVFIAPLGIYSSQINDLSDLPDGAVVTIPGDATNGGRALQLLAREGLLSLTEGVRFHATVQDITSNPKNLQIKELESPQLPRSLADAAISVINVNFVLEAGLNPAEDALALEEGQGNPYANVLAVVKGRENDAALQRLAELFNSPEVKAFMETEMAGAVIPAF